MSHQKSSPEIKSSQFVKLSPIGLQKHKKLESDCMKNFLFYAVVANLSGIALALLVKRIPLRNVSLSKQKRYRNITFSAVSLAFTYHGYKTSQRELKQGLRDLMKHEENIFKSDLE